MSRILRIYSSAGGQIGWVHFPPILTKRSQQEGAGISVTGCGERTEGNTGSCGGSDLRNPRMVSTVTIDLHPSAVSNSFFFPHSLQHSSNFLMTAILKGVGWHLQHLLMALDIEYSKSSY